MAYFPAGNLISSTAIRDLYNPERLPDMDCAGRRIWEGNDRPRVPLSLVEPGQSLRNRVDLVVVTPMWKRKELGN
jgi:hypothetical protein